MPAALAASGARGRGRLLAAAGCLTAALILVVGVAVPASAHVTVHSSDAAPGSFAELIFRVPTESDTASTVKLAVQLPPAHPLAFVSVRPVPGWTVAVQKTTLATPVQTDDGPVTEAVSEITWTATGGGLSPGQYEDFAISAGPLPRDVTALTFPAVQTYSDGQVVRWIEPATTGGPPPEHPAPQLSLSVSTQAATAAANRTPEAGSDSDALTRGLAIAGVVVGLAGAAVAVWALRRRAG